MKLTKEIIKEISTIKNEPDWMYNFRLKAFEYFDTCKNPSWGPNIDVDFDSITYYKKRTEDLRMVRQLPKNEERKFLIK